MKKLLPILVLLMFAKISISQETAKENSLYFDLEAQGVFNNHEFKRHIAYGYTLGGFRLVPKLSYNITNDLSLDAGINALRYWGANEYPLYNYVSVPEYDSVKQQKYLHVLPYFRFTWQINDKTSLLVGNIDNSDGHGLDIALWNPELGFSMDSEEGLQLRYNSKYWQNEVWVNWQNFNFKNDIDRESFLLGISGSIMGEYSKKSATEHMYSNTHYLVLDYSFLWQHHGGELDTLSSLDLDHWINGNIGLNYMISLPRSKVYGLMFSLDWLYCKALKNDTWFFKAGNALFAKVSLFGQRYSARLGYYYSKDMISFYGSPFFSNIAQRNTMEYYPENKLLYAHFDYTLYKKKNADISVFTDLYYKLDKNTSLAQETNQLSFSLGIKTEIGTRHLIGNFNR